MALIILTTLKFIGMLLLAVLSLLIAASAIILFVPVRYIASVEGEASTLLELPLELRASWLMHIVRLQITGDDSGRVMVIKVLFVTVKRTRLGRSGDDDQCEGDSSESDESENFNISGESDVINESDEPNKSIFARIKEIVNKIRNFYNQPDRDEIIRLTSLLVKRLLRAARPKRFRVRGEVGFSKPQTTGYFFAALGMAGALTKLDIKIAGNFKESVARLLFDAKGSINLFSVFWPIAMYILSKPIWRIAKKIFFKKERV